MRRNNVRVTRLLNEAKKTSEQSNHQHQIGCIIVKGGNILSRGFNQVRYSKRGCSFTNYPESLHAERAATRNLSREALRGSTVFVYRRGKEGSGRNAKPCRFCEDLLRFVGIKTCYYSDETSPTGYSKIKI